MTSPFSERIGGEAGCHLQEKVEKMREVVELPILHPEKWVKLLWPSRNWQDFIRTNACVLHPCYRQFACSEERARMVRELFQMARSKKACIVFFDEVGSGGDNEVQRTMLEIVNQLDGFDARCNIS